MGVFHIVLMQTVSSTVDAIKRPMFYHFTSPPFLFELGTAMQIHLNSDGDGHEHLIGLTFHLMLSM